MIMNIDTLVKILNEACDSAYHLKSTFEYCDATYAKTPEDKIMLAQAIKKVCEMQCDIDSTSEMYHTAAWIEHEYNLKASQDMNTHDFVNFLKKTLTMK